MDYDDSFLTVARERTLLEAREAFDKASLRAALRARPGGEERWQALQAEVYGPRILAARPAAGCAACLREQRRRGAQLFIISHKTRFAAAAPGGASLHDAAWSWLEAAGFLGPEMVPPEHVYFEETRAAKLARIGTLAVSIAIDDLVDVFEDAAFPASVERWLFAPRGAPPGPWRAFASWPAIAAALDAR